MTSRTAATEVLTLALSHSGSNESSLSIRYPEIAEFDRIQIRVIMDQTEGRVIGDNETQYIKIIRDFLNKPGVKCTQSILDLFVVGHHYHSNGAISLPQQEIIRKIPGQLASVYFQRCQHYKTLFKRLSLPTARKKTPLKAMTRKDWNIDVIKSNHTMTVDLNSSRPV